MQSLYRPQREKKDLQGRKEDCHSVGSGEDPLPTRQQNVWSSLIFVAPCLETLMSTVYLFCPVLPVMVSGLGMSPGKHLQMGFPSLNTEKWAGCWLILYQIVVEKKATQESGFYIEKWVKKVTQEVGFSSFQYRPTRLKKWIKHTVQKCIITNMNYILALKNVWFIPYRTAICIKHRNLVKNLWKLHKYKF